MLLQQVAIQVNDEHDFITIKFGSINARIGYRIGFEIEHHIRVAAKQAARFDRAPASFWREVDLDDLNDTPKTHRTPRQSMLAPTVASWAVGVNPPLVRLQFDSMCEEMEYETAVKVGHLIRRASRRAKAWAGDTSQYSKMIGYLTDAEEDQKLGLG